MSHWLDEPRVRQDVVTIPRLWVTIALSILIHVAVLFIWIPRTDLLTPGDQEDNQLTDRLQVRLAAPPAPAPPPAPSAPQAQASLPSPPRPPRTVARLRPPPVVTVPNPQAPAIVPPPPAPPVVAAPTKPSPPLAGDLTAYVQATRRDRCEQE